MLNEFLYTKIEEEDFGNIWFQQDGTTCHTAEATLDVLRPVFVDHIFSRRVDVVWPPQSCDLTSSAISQYYSSIIGVSGDWKLHLYKSERLQCSYISNQETKYEKNISFDVVT